MFLEVKKKGFLYLEFENGFVYRSSLFGNLPSVSSPFFLCIWTKIPLTAVVDDFEYLDTNLFYVSSNIISRQAQDDTWINIGIEKCVEE